MTGHTKKWKAAQLAELQELAGKYPVIAIASLNNFPGALAKQLRKKLQGKAVVKVSKTRIVKKALVDSKVDLGGLDEHVTGNIAVIFSEMNPFELYAVLKKNSVSMPAKEGSIAQDDIIIPAGDTGLPPGPALSDLKAAGLKTIMQGPTISIAEDKVVAKKGEPVTAGVAGALSKLNIKPIKVKLSVTAGLEKGQVYLADVLDIDADQVFQDFATASRNAFNIAIEIAYTTKETMPVLITKGYRGAKAVAIEANILNSATVGDVLAKASAQANVLKVKVPEAPAEEKAEEPKAEAEEAKPVDKAKPAEEAPAEEAKPEEKKKEPAEEKKEEPAEKKE